jgi:hypothetical protein
VPPLFVAVSVQFVIVAPAHPHDPPMQAAPDAQAFPHEPQLFGSLAVSTQLPPTPPSPEAMQSVEPPRQVTPHLPIEHTWPVGQTFPQVPQLFGSLAVSTQVALLPVPHSMEPPRQVTPHLPVEQTWPVGQTFPQAPQLFGSLAVWTQLPAPASPVQSVELPRQVTPHLPVEQTWPVAQAFPQVPQLFGSLAVSTQLVPQSIDPAPQFVPEVASEPPSDVTGVVPELLLLQPAPANVSPSKAVVTAPAMCACALLPSLREFFFIAALRGAVQPEWLRRRDAPLCRGYGLSVAQCKGPLTRCLSFALSLARVYW